MTAQVVTVTETVYSSVKKIKWAWVCTDAGAVSSACTKVLNGEILKVVFVPTDPTDQYDAVLNDNDSVDLLFGQGANLSGTNTIVLTEGLGAVCGGLVTLVISNAGNAKGGTTYLYVR
jgi:hypothetical protein